MATVQISGPLDLLNLAEWYGTTAAADSTHITIVNGPLVGTYIGSFTYDTQGNVYGTLKGINETLYGQPIFNISGLDLSAHYVQQLLQANSISALEETVLSGNDQFSILTPGTHVIDGFGGYNTVSEVGAYSTYSMTSSGSATVVQGPGSRDTLYNVEGI